FAIRVEPGEIALARNGEKRDRNLHHWSFDLEDRRVPRFAHAAPYLRGRGCSSVPRFAPLSAVRPAATGRGAAQGRDRISPFPRTGRAAPSATQLTQYSLAKRSISRLRRLHDEQGLS